MKNQIRKYLLKLQKDIDDKTEYLNDFPEDEDWNYYDGYNDAKIELLHKLQKILKIT